MPCVLYEQAILSAREHVFVQNEGLAYEVAAKFFITMAESDPGMHATHSSGGAGWRAMWQCTHSIGSPALKALARQHLVGSDAERVEIATGVDRSAHPPGLFRCHVGERARDDFGRRRRLVLAGQPRGDAETGEPDAAVAVSTRMLAHLSRYGSAPARAAGRRSRPAGQECARIPSPGSVARATARAARHQGQPAPA
jgi:hypothetical protein